MKIRLVGVERKDRRTDMTKLIVAFRKFVKVPNKSLAPAAFEPRMFYPVA
jgi:hypothetical protein